MNAPFISTRRAISRRSFLKGTGVAIPPEQSAAGVFRQLFLQGTPKQIEAQLRELDTGRKILDAVADQPKGLAAEGRRERPQPTRSILHQLRIVAVVLLGGALSGLAAEPTSESSTNAPARRSGFRPPPPPRNPVPILPALAAPDDTSFYASNNVAHGRVEIVHYTTSGGAEKRMHVYVPPGYDTDTERRYPVLYLNHGGGENDSHWTEKGATHHILDNLIAAGKARPMIVAMPNTGGVVSGKPPKPGEDDVCTQEYLRDILPFVDGRYRTLTTRASRAVAGLSMGGFVTLKWRRYLWQTAQIMFPKDR